MTFRNDVKLLLQTTARRVAPRSQSIASKLRHLGAAGLFFLAILDGSPLPTFGGPDILTALLAASHRDPWYEYATMATAGSVIGAYITFRIARGAGTAYLEKKFKKNRVAAVRRMFDKWGTGVLFASVAVPFPSPTSVLFAAAGASDYSLSKFLAIVATGRALRYSAIALVADIYGRHFIRVLRHPSQYWGWSLVLVGLLVGVTIAAILLNRRMATVPAE